MTTRRGWPIALALFCAVLQVTAAVREQAVAPEPRSRAPIGREVAVPTHLRDGEEFSLPLRALLAHGQLLFDARWTEQEGAGRPLTKGTGRPLADPSQAVDRHARGTAGLAARCCPEL